MSRPENDMAKECSPGMKEVSLRGTLPTIRPMELEELYNLMEMCTSGCGRTIRLMDSGNTGISMDLSTQASG